MWIPRTEPIRAPAVYAKTIPYLRDEVSMLSLTWIVLTGLGNRGAIKIQEWDNAQTALLVKEEIGCGSPHSDRARYYIRVGCDYRIN